MNDLHGQIMNIQADPDKLKEMDQPTLLAYKEGHRDARHAAAELSLQYDSRIEELERLAREALKELEEFREDVERFRDLEVGRLRETLGTPTQYVIRNSDALRAIDEEITYWNNDIGWVSQRDYASRFTQDERDNIDLPMYGYWERL